MKMIGESFGRGDRADNGEEVWCWVKDRGVKDVTFVGVAFCGKIVKVTYR